MEVNRGAERITIRIQPVDACRVEINSSISLDVQAYTNGRRIVVTRGLLERLSEEEVRSVIAHELAHCVMGHLRKTALNSIAGRFSGPGDACTNAFGWVVFLLQYLVICEQSR